MSARPRSRTRSRSRWACSSSASSSRATCCPPTSSACRSSIANERLRFHPGPIFAQLILADEVNRATPKTQSALLEAMEEHQVTAEGETRALPEPFFVIATQNPSHQVGTFPLPESQLDRFLMRIELGYPDARRRARAAAGRRPPRPAAAAGAVHAARRSRGAADAPRAKSTRPAPCSTICRRSSTTRRKSPEYIERPVAARGARAAAMRRARGR